MNVRACGRGERKPNESQYIAKTPSPFQSQILYLKSCMGFEASASARVLRHGTCDVAVNSALSNSRMNATTKSSKINEFKWREREVVVDRMLARTLKETSMAPKFRTGDLIFSLCSNVVRVQCVLDWSWLVEDEIIVICVATLPFFF